MTLRQVIHAGLYYERGSAKARLCVPGRDALYAYCAERGVTARRVGKLVVATQTSQLPKLEALAKRASANGVQDLVWLSGASDVAAVEPQVRGVAGLWSPSTGVVDSHGFMVALQADAEAHGAIVALNTKLLSGRREGDSWILDTATTTGKSSSNSSRSSFHGDDDASQTSNAEPSFSLQCHTVVNCAGLAASQVALALGCPPHTIPRTYFAKGNYFALQGVPPPFTKLVYPLPEAAGLGVHATVDLGGRVRFGPDVEWLPNQHDSPFSTLSDLYSVDPSRAAVFYGEVRKYWPELPDNALVPDYAGLRPKLHGPPASQGGPQVATDFFFQGPKLRNSYYVATNRNGVEVSPGAFQGHGLPGLVNLLGFESPGLTASLAIADEIALELKEVK